MLIIHDNIIIYYKELNKWLAKYFMDNILKKTKIKVMERIATFNYTFAMENKIKEKTRTNADSNEICYAMINEILSVYVHELVPIYKAKCNIINSSNRSEQIINALYELLDAIKKFIVYRREILIKYTMIVLIQYVKTTLLNMHN